MVDRCTLCTKSDYATCKGSHILQHNGARFTPCWALGALT